MINKAPINIQKSLKQMRYGIESRLRNTFSYPCPSFPPVFGESQVAIMSPFGKVRFPIIFKWISYKGAERYEISIEGTNWSVETKRTSVEVKQEELELNLDEGYIWQFKVLTQDREILEEVSGYFSLPTIKRTTRDRRA